MATQPDIGAELEQVKRQQLLLARAVKIALTVILSTLGGICVRAISTIPTMREILRDLLEGSDLPALTRFVMGHPDLLLLVAALLVLIGLGSLVRLKSAGAGILVATITIVLVFVEWQVIVGAL